MLGAPKGYGIARSNLVRALKALRAYRSDAIVVVGAQAIYLQSQADDLPFSPFTLDSDIAVDPRILEEVPPIRETLELNGYQHRDGQPGLYWASGSDDENSIDGAAVDILVPEEFAIGRGRRDARLPGHNRGAARRTRGLEAALYDKDVREIVDFSDVSNTAHAYVAGPAALLIAKAEKIADRGEERLKAKDASDVYVLLRAYDVNELKTRFVKLATHADLNNAFDRGIAALRNVFTEGGRGRELFVAAIDRYPERDELLESYRFLIEDLRSAIADFG